MSSPTPSACTTRTPRSSPSWTPDRAAPSTTMTTGGTSRASATASRTRRCRSRVAPARSRHHPDGRDPTTFAASTTNTGASCLVGMPRCRSGRLSRRDRDQARLFLGPERRRRVARQRAANLRCAPDRRRDQHGCGPAGVGRFRHVLSSRATSCSCASSAVALIVPHGVFLPEPAVAMRGGSGEPRRAVALIVGRPRRQAPPQPPARDLLGRESSMRHTAVSGAGGAKRVGGAGGRTVRTVGRSGRRP